MPLQSTSGAASYDAFGGGAPAIDLQYIEDIFSCFLYTGNGSTQTITNGLDLSTKGGLTWIKSRSTSTSNFLFDTARGALNEINSNTTDAQASLANSLTSFNTNGFSLGSESVVNGNANKYASWTFRKKPKFFDIVSYTGTGSNTTIAHSLGSVPGSIWVKRTDTTGAWQVYHRSLANTEYLVLNTTAAKATGATRWNSTTPTSAVFSIGTDATVNASGGTYVAYLFAHDAGGFGLTGADNVISCGSFTNSGSTVNISLGYEAQLVLMKNSNSTGNWFIFDTMRGMAQTQFELWHPNLSGLPEEKLYQGPFATATGFSFNPVNNAQFTSGDYIYIAIRRGLMKVPTDATKVFSPVSSSTNSGEITSGFPTDMVLSLDRTAGTAGYNRMVQDRLRGPFIVLDTARTQADDTNATTASFQLSTGIVLNGGSVYGNGFVHEQFRRAPSFFDIVCYTGTGSNRTVTHNLGAVPELMIVKRRSSAADWNVYVASVGNTKYMFLNLTDAPITSSTLWNNTTPTSSVFTVGTEGDVNSSGGTFVAYLFSTCAGVSKVGSYTGTATTNQINCGFTAGARFVLVKRTDSTGDWYVWDSARGIIAGNDPYLLLNSAAAQVTNTDYIDTYSAGFEISSSAPAAINASGGSYIFLAIA